MKNMKNTLRKKESMEKLRKWYSTSQIDIIDWMMYGLLIIIGATFFCYNYDLPVTIEQSNDAINILFSGKIFQFYSVEMEHALNGYYSFGESMLNAPYYNVIVYLILGVWNLPIRILELWFDFATVKVIYIMWSKVGIILLGGVAAKIINCICENMVDKGIFLYKNINYGFLFLTSGIFLYGNVIFGQLDIIAVVSVLLGLYFLSEDKMIHFCLLLSFAICIKGFAVFILIPIVLLFEKRIMYILRNLTVGLSLPLLYKIIYHFDAGYSTISEFMNSNYGFKERLFAATLSGGANNIDIFLLIIGVVCAISYYTTDEKKIWRGVFVFPLIIFLAFSIFVLWHPQWLVIMSPFIVFGYGLIDNVKEFLLTEVIWNIGYIIVSISRLWAVDVYMLNDGILTKILNKPYVGASMAELINNTLKLTNLTDIALTILAVGSCGLILLLFKDVKKEGNQADLNKGLVGMRILPVVIFIMAALVMYSIY